MDFSESIFDNNDEKYYEHYFFRMAGMASFVRSKTYNAKKHNPTFEKILNKGE